MKKIFLAFIFTSYFSTALWAQDKCKDFIVYYKTRYNAFLENNPSKKIKKEIKAYKIMTPEVIDVLYTSEYALREGKCHNVKKLLFKAAKCGVRLQEIIEVAPTLDSLLRKRKLETKYKRIYNRNIAILDWENSCKIIQLYERDQMVRTGSECFSYTDTLIKNCYSKYWSNIDSSNYFNLKEIINTAGFDFSKLTRRAKRGSFLILCHSMTIDQTKNERDSIIFILKEMMENGNLQNEEFANAMDRYYHITKNGNYYYSFINRDLPIYDIENIDKRRKEIGLLPLYLRYKQLNKLNRLPKNYKYDINTIDF